MADHRSGPRRRGSVLEQAITAAVVQELAEVGYARLTVESVAARAGASKVSIYRRWSTKRDLVLAVGQQLAAQLREPADTGSLESDLSSWLRTVADRLDGPLGQALVGVVSDVLAESDGPALVNLTSGSMLETARLLVERARDRGEVLRPGLTDQQLEVPIALLRYHYLVHSSVAPQVVDGIVRDVTVPLWTGGLPE